MVVTNDFKEEMINKVSADLGSGKVGTSGQVATENNTALIAPVAGTTVGLDGSVAGKQITITYNLDSVSGNGNVLKEYGSFLSSGALIQRSNFFGISKTNNIELQVTTTLQVI